MNSLEVAAKLQQISTLADEWQALMKKTEDLKTAIYELKAPLQAMFWPKKTFRCLDSLVGRASVFKEEGIDINELVEWARTHHDDYKRERMDANEVNDELDALTKRGMFRFVEGTNKIALSEPMRQWYATRFLPPLAW